MEVEKKLGGELARELCAAGGPSQISCAHNLFDIRDFTARSFVFAGIELTTIESLLENPAVVV